MTTNSIRKYPENLVDTIGPMVAKIMKDIDKIVKDVHDIRKLLERATK